ncbi:MAG TPA: type VI secretion system-associated protein TagF [Burkholderiaceae bacterium]|nr:type VI secretion system-associated protein TagF [Burkholderiaceae bacterium]
MLQLLPEDFLSSDSGAAGWYGKIPALGDFASRRLPTEFTQRWDAWLARAIETSQAALGGAWLDTYLSGPLWRFALSPGIIDARFWFGVLMPSVDRVGRYFPLTIATATALPPSPPLAALEQWYERAATAALGCLTPGASVERLESALASLGALNFYPSDVSITASDAVLARLPAAQGLEQAFAHAAAPLLLRDLRGASYWWARFEGIAPPAVVVHRGLPDAATFVRLLDGSL